MAAHIAAYIDMMNKSEYTLEDFKTAQALSLPDVTPQDLSGKNVIVTGANTGLGFEVAKSIATMKPQTLILACRNLDKANQALESIKQATGCTALKVEELDLASFDSVKKFSKRILDQNIPIDVLISNAGVATFADWVVTKDGYELCLQINHLSNVLMVLLLVPALRKAKNPRVNIVSSNNHFWTQRPDPTDPTPIQSLNKQGPAQYASTKLMNVLFVAEFARRFPDIFVCSSNPGYCMSELGVKNNENGDKLREKTNMFADQGVIMRDLYEGAKTLIACAIQPEFNKSGAYYSDMKEIAPRTSTQGESGKQFAKNAWNDTMEILCKVADSPLPEK